MPFYEYECSSCKFYIEVLQKVSDPPLKKCPSCKKATMKKLVSAPVFRLKGGGWYETDFKSDKEGRRNLAVDKEPAANDSTMESKPSAAKAPDSKAADAKPADGKASESKASESKASESKAAPSEPAASPSRSRRRVAPAAKRAPAARSKPKPRSRARSKRR